MCKSSARLFETTELVPAGIAATFQRSQSGKRWGKKRLTEPGEGVTSEPSCSQGGVEGGPRARGWNDTGAGKSSRSRGQEAPILYVSRVRGRPLLNWSPFFFHLPLRLRDEHQLHYARWLGLNITQACLFSCWDSIPRGNWLVVLYAVYTTVASPLPMTQPGLDENFLTTERPIFD